jgi:hypothetical protein
MDKFKAILSLALLVFVAPVAADKWAPPTTQVYESAGGSWRLTVIPRDISSPLAYFQDKVDKRPNAGGLPGSTQSSAIGRVEHRVNGKWLVAWQQPLSNEVAPVNAVVADGGRLATFDNWHGMGYGRNVVVIYDENGKLVRALALQDFLPQDYLKSLPRSVSSLHWRGEPRAEGQQLVVPVVVPSMSDDEGYDNREYIELRFDLVSGERIDDPGTAWKRALERVHAKAKQIDAYEAAEKAKFIAPLQAPTSTREQDWYGYMQDAYFRLGGDAYPGTTVIRVPSAPDAAESVRNLREFLAEGGGQGGAQMIASPSQDVLVDVLRREAAKIKPGSLAGARVYVVVDAAHLQAVRKALAHLGGEFVQIDPARAIPQDQKRLEQFLKRSAEPDE